MNNIFLRLTTRVSLAMIIVVVLSMAVIVRHWAFVTAPALKAAEQTKAELLITPYTQLLEAAVDGNDGVRLGEILNQLVLLEDSTWREPVVLGLKISLLDGRVIERRNKVKHKAVPFRAEMPIFSPGTGELLGSVTLEYNDAFYNRLIGEVWREMGGSMGLALLLLLAMQYWVRCLLKPLTDLSSRLACVDLDSHVSLPPPDRSVSAEIRQVWESIEQLLARLRQRDEALEEEHAAVREALQARLAAEEANQEKSQFLANMSHELRTPLNAIIGYSEMLYEDINKSGNAEMAEDLVHIVSAGKHLLSLINDVLDLSKIAAGEMQLYLNDVSLPQLVSEVLDNVEPLVVSNGNSVTVDCDERIGSIHTDRTRLKQVLVNVLGNAAKFTHNGEVGLFVTRVVDKADEWVEFRVVDTGIGISEKQQKHLFKAFTQVDESATRQYDGTGLGLTISRSMCQLMGGDIMVTSQLESGSEFVIKIPAEVASIAGSSVVNMLNRQPVLAPVHVAKKAFSGDVTKPHEKLPAILIIDDDPSVGDLLQRTLREENYYIEIVSHGREGLERAVELVPDLIILDVVMPDMSGWSVLSQLKKNPTLLHVPVIMHSMTDERTMAATLGAASYINKPADKNELIGVIKNHLHSSMVSIVLVVGGSVDARRLTKMVFENEGWNIVEGADGKVGLMRVAEKIPSVIVLDTDLPTTMSATEFVQTLEKHEKWKTIPVLVLTGPSISDEEREKLLIHVDMVIEKGAYSLDTLLRRLRELIGPSRSETATG